MKAIFTKKKFPSPVKPFSSGYKLEDYVIGKQIGKGCNAAVYEAAAPFAPLGTNGECSLVELKQDGEERDVRAPLNFPRPHGYPLAVKMMWNIGVGSSSAMTYCYALVQRETLTHFYWDCIAGWFF